MTTNNTTIPQSAYAIASGSTGTDPFVTQFSLTDPTSNDVNYPIQKRWFNTALNREWILLSFSVVGEIKSANWQQVTSGTVSTETLTGNTGGAVAPDGSNTIFVVGDSSTVSVAGNAGTHTLTISAMASVPTTFVEDTGSAVPVANTLNIHGNAGITTQGSGSTVTITAGPTIATTYTENSGSATPSGNNLNILGSNGITTSGSGSTVTINGSSLFRSINIQVITSTGTYTPTAGMLYCQIQCLGGGGAGGGARATGASEYSSGGGGGAGEYAVGFFSAATIGVSQAVTIGAAGTGSSGANGGNGGTTQVGALISCGGGTGGIAGPVSSGTGLISGGGAGGTGGSGGSYRTVGFPGINGLSAFTAQFSFGGTGASSQIGSGGLETPGFGVGTNASGYGAGGNGANQGNGGGPSPGGNGTAGIVVITEYI